ncbi:MAG: extracellular solute-binding protein [Ruminococcus sp.]|nr:extracellular solute-binding protein [Ruminococcus sp.]
MKKNTFRRAAAGILAAALVGASAVSCGDSKPKAKPQQTAAEVVQHSYSAMPLDTDMTFNYVEQMSSTPDGKVMIVGSTGESMTMYLTDTDFSEFTEVDMQLDLPENAESYFRSTMTPDGKILALVTITEYSQKIPDYDSPDFDAEAFDWDSFYKSAKTSYRVVTIDSSGNVLSNCEVNGLEKFSSDDDEGAGLYIDSLIPCSDGRVILQISGDESRCVIMDEDGKIGDEVNLGEDIWFYNSCVTSDGRLAFATWEDESNGQVIRFVDTDAMKITDDKIKVKDTSLNNIGTLLPGADDYILYASGAEGLYGLREDGSGEELINWIDSDLNGDYIRGVVALEDGDFLILEQDWSTSNGVNFYRITERDITELENTIVITLGLMYTDPEITSKVNAFNKSSDKYRIRISDYSKYDEWDSESDKMLNSSSKQLKMDIVSGNAPDMIYTYDLSVIKTLASKNVFTDLYGYLGTDGAVSKDDFVPGVLEAGESNGKLLSISPTFTVSSLAAKSKFADQESWDLDKLIETYENLPDGMKLFSDANTKEGVFGQLSNGCSGYIDYDAGTCSFDSDEFVKLLEFSNTFPEDDDTPDWETASDEEMDEYYNEVQLACRNDKALLYGINLYTGREYAQAKYGAFGDDITMVGYPTNNGRGGRLNLGQSFAILENAADKDACWQFISSFFTEDSYNTDDRRMAYGLPSLKAPFGKLLDEATDKPYWTDENGKKEYYDDQYWIGNDLEPLTIDPLTKEERDALEKYVLESASASTYIYSSEISDIVNEEISPFFAGERSAQETAEIIQNRASLILSEQS